MAFYRLLALAITALLVSCTSVPAYISTMTPEQIQALSAHKNAAILCTLTKGAIGTSINVFVNVDREYELTGKISVEPDCKVYLDNVLVPLPPPPTQLQRQPRQGG